MSEKHNNNESINRLAESLADQLSLKNSRHDELDEAVQDIYKQFSIISQIAQLHQPDDTDCETKTKPTTAQVQFNWGRLKVKNKIGEGSYGEVYQAYDEILDRDVALKLLKKDLLRPLNSQTFIEEARRLAKVRHPHVLAIYGANVYEGQAGFWCDLIVGHTLDHQPIGAPLSFAELFKITRDLSKGLDAIHHEGIIHGDIKPANVMCDQRNDYLIMDFGAGIRFEELDQMSDYVHGTPLLMAPELFEQQHTGTAIDIYALGATLFKLATSHYPVQGDDMLAIQQAHQKKETTKLKVLRPDLPQAFADLVDEMMSAHADQRPHTNDILQRLYHIETAPQRRRNKLAIWSIVSALVLGMIFSSWGFYQANQAKNEALLAQSKAESVNEFLQDMLEASSELGGGRDVRVADVLNQASDKLINSPPKQVEVAIEMHQSLANSYNSLRETEKSLFHAQSSVDLARRIFDKDDERLIKGQLELVHALEIKGDHQASIELVDKIISHAEATLGKDHWYIQVARKYKVTNFLAMAEYDQAIEILETHFSQVPDAKNASNNLGYEILQAKANAYSVKGQFEDAIRVAKEGIAWLDEYPRKSLFNQQAIISVLGTAQLKQGLIEEGVANMTKALELVEILNGKESEDYLDGLVNLGAAQRLQNNPEMAQKTTIQAYELAKRIYGDKQNLRTVGIGTNLANLLVDSGDIEQGEAVMRESLQMSYEVLGLQKPESLILEYNLAELLNNQNRFVEALEYAISTYAKKIETFGANHPYVFLSQDNRAISLSGLGRHNEAIEQHDQAAAGIEAALGAEHPYTLMVKQHQVNTMISAGQSVEAKILLQPLVEQLKTVMGENDAETIKYSQLLLTID